MPIYEYSCRSCEHVFELLRPMRRMKAPATCPCCGKKHAEKLMSAPGAIDVRRGWNEKANEYQRDPYTQAKAQLTNAYNSARDRGQDVAKPSEEGIQVAARAIATEKERSARPSMEQQHVAVAQRAARKKLAEKK